MKRTFFITGLLLISFSGLSQDAIEILKRSYAKCQSVHNGYYEMTSYMKYMSKKDTVPGIYKCYFKKLKDDSVYASAFHLQVFDNGAYGGDFMYTGDAFVDFYSDDSTVTIKLKSKWAARIKASIGNYKLYSPFTSKKSWPLLHDSDLNDVKRTFKLIGDEMINGTACYHIQVNNQPQYDSTEAAQALRIEFQYWIRKDDYLPIQYSFAYDDVMDNDTQYQYEKIVLNKYDLNNLKDESSLTMGCIPDYCKLNYFVPRKHSELLPKDTIAPNWTLLSLNDEKVSLSDLKGQLVLIDFFYKGCVPCMQAIPGLQVLHEKYKDKGLKIIGIDPVDKVEDDIVQFLAKRGVTYTVLMDGKVPFKDYRIWAFPTIYLIDRNGKVIFTNVGYDKATDEKLEEVIKQNL